jgi:acetoin utilization protein AcuB
MLVGASMTTEVCTANPEMMMEDAIDLCQEHSMRHLPILEQGALVGMISDRDLRFGLGQEIVSDIRAQEEGRMEIPRTQVSALMSADVITIGADRTLEHAAETMLEHGFSALPVVRKGELVGILTNTDILRSCS